MKEKELQKTILDYLRLKKFIAVKFNQSIFVGKLGEEGRFIKSPQKGVSDILACSPTGQFWAIEVKAEKGKPTEDQLNFLYEVNMKGGKGILAYKLEDVIDEDE